MNRKRIIYAIVIISGIVSVTLSQILGPNVGMLLFAFYVPFHIISLIFYRESKTITAYHILQVFSLFGFFMMLQLQGQYFRLFGLISFIGSFLTLLLAFGLVLQNRSFKLNERSFMWFSIYALIFFSIYQPFILNLLTNFFGPFPIAIRRTIDTFHLIRTILLGLNIVLQVLCIRNNEINIYLDKQEKKYQVESNKISDLPFFD